MLSPRILYCCGAVLKRSSWSGKNGFCLSVTSVFSILRELLVLENDHVLGIGMTKFAFVERHNRYHINATISCTQDSYKHEAQNLAQRQYKTSTSDLNGSKLNYARPRPQPIRSYATRHAHSEVTSNRCSLFELVWCNPGTRKPGFVCGQKPGFDGLKFRASIQHRKACRN